MLAAGHRWTDRRRRPRRGAQDRLRTDPFVDTNRQHPRAAPLRGARFPAHRARGDRPGPRRAQLALRERAVTAPPQQNRLRASLGSSGSAGSRAAKAYGSRRRPQPGLGEGVAFCSRCPRLVGLARASPGIRAVSDRAWRGRSARGRRPRRRGRPRRSLPVLRAPRPGSQVVDPGHAARAQHPVDLRQAAGGVGLVVQRERAHHDFEARIRGRERGDVADKEFHPVRHTRAGGQRARPLDHLGHYVQASHPRPGRARRSSRPACRARSRPRAPPRRAPTRPLPPPRARRTRRAGVT